MSRSTEISHPPIDADYTVVDTRQHLSFPAILHGISHQTLKHWKLSTAALGFLALSGAALSLTTEPGQDVLKFGQTVKTHGFVEALQRRSDEIQAGYDQKCSNFEGSPIEIKSQDGDVAVRKEPSVTSEILNRIGNGLILSVGENSQFIVVCDKDKSGQNRAGYISKKYTSSPK